MATDYVIDVEGRIVYSRGWGEFTNADVADFRERLKADPQFDPTFKQLIDFAKVTHF